MWASRALARLGAPAAALLLLLATTLQIQVSSGSSIVKRSLSALARTSQLPHSSSSEPGGHEQDHGGHPHTPGEPHKRSELQEEALREELLRQRAAPATEALLSAILEADPFENGVEDKRSLSSLARYGNLPIAVDDKRSLASLAREGNYPISLDDKRSLAALAREGNLPLQDDKRSLSSLARYGNLPLPAAAKRSLEALARGGLLNKNTRVDANKRSLSALARAGELPKRWRPPHQREQSEDLLDHLQRELEQTKRGLSSLARGASLPRAAAFEDALSLPISMEEQQGKRSLQSLARAWSLPEPKRSPPYGAFDDVEWVKRNAAALLRQSKLTGGDAADDGTRRNDLESERQGQGRRKRSLWDSEAGEVVSPYVQSSSSGQDPDWDGLPLWSPTAWGAYFGLGEDAVPQPAQQKRFLGRIPNMGRHRQKTNEDSSPRRRRPH